MKYTTLHLQNGETPLYTASQEGRVEIVDHLLAAKADVNLQRKVGSDFSTLLEVET